MKYFNNRLMLMKKTGICLPIFLILSIIIGFTVNAEQTLKPTDRFFVNDFSNVITDTDEDTIYSLGAQLQEKTGAQVVAATIDSLDGKDIREKGVEIARDWGIGQKGKNNGILLLLAVNDRKIDIEVGYGLEGDLTDAETGYILDTYAMPYLKNNDYSTGMREAYKALINEVYSANGMEMPDQNYVPAKDKVTNLNRKKIYSYIPAGIILLILFSFFFHRGRRGGWPPFIFFGGGRGGFGGFGGFGGGFGGDGGGFSGGGGSFGGGGGSRGF